jgi:hypothetical protein
LSPTDPAGADAGTVGQGSMASLPGTLPSSGKYMPSQGAGAQLGSLGGGETEMAVIGGGARAKSSHQAGATAQPPNSSSSLNTLLQVRVPSTFGFVMVSCCPSGKVIGC